MQPKWGRAAGLALGLFAAGEARASSIDGEGHLVFDAKAIQTFGFESLTSAESVSATWGTWEASTPTIYTVPVTAATWQAATVTGEEALEGSAALQISASSGYLGLVIRDTALFAKIMHQRVSVSMWGRAFGAEPELDLIYPSTDEQVGPVGFGRITAIRTGNETSDGWVEYSTGPIDGSLWAEPLSAILLTARYTTTDDTLSLISPSLFPGTTAPLLLDSSAYAVVDALEIDPEPGPIMSVVPCTQANAGSVCGSLGTCIYGHCVDSSVVWGPVPPSAAMRAEAVQRWEFTAEHLGGDRHAAETATTAFSASAIKTAEAATSPAVFYETLTTMVASVRDGHTTLGDPASGATFFHPYVSTFQPEPSGLLDLCFGLAQDDLPGGSGGPVYAIFWMSATSALAGAVQEGSILQEIDGMTPDAWMSALELRIEPMLPNDPTSLPAGRALVLSRAIDKYASTVVFSNCDATGTCTPATVDVGAITYEELRGTGYKSATRNSRPCTGRFTESVSTWTPSDDTATYDVPITETAGGIVAVEANGFNAAYDQTNMNPYHAWEDPFTTALSAGLPVLVDYRYGHGGRFKMGAFLVERVRGTGDPYAAFVAPRGDFDDPDPPFLSDPSLGACVFEPEGPANLCGWMGAISDEAVEPSPPGGSVKIAWLDGNNVSMNDVVPRELQGAPNVRIFGPHATSGAYGEISRVPPVLGSWYSGSIQTLDSRFGVDMASAQSAPWASGVGVSPDQVVLQTMSDLLAGNDTILTTAKAWLVAP